MNPHYNVWLPRILALAPLVAAACLSALLLTGCGEKKAAGPAAPTVEVVDVVQKDVPIVREWVGTTDGLVNAKINAQVQGYLIKQNYKEGSEVKKGQVLFEIDPRPFQAALEQAKGQLAVNEGQFYTAKANLEKIRPLAAVNAVSKKDLDDAIGREASARPRCRPPRRRCARPKSISASPRSPRPSTASPASPRPNWAIWWGVRGGRS